MPSDAKSAKQDYQPPELNSVDVKYTPDGEPEEITCSFPATGGLAWFEVDGDLADYDMSIHSVDLDAAEEAVLNLPFINEVDMTYDRD